MIYYKYVLYMMHDILGMIFDVYINCLTFEAMRLPFWLCHMITPGSRNGFGQSENGRIRCIVRMDVYPGPKVVQSDERIQISQDFWVAPGQSLSCWKLSNSVMSNFS